MSEGIIVAIIMLLGSGTAGLWAWLRSRRKNEVEVEAAKQLGLSERFDDANQLSKYVKEQVEAAVAPLRDEIENLKKQSHRVHNAFRRFFTQLWVWDRDGRVGPMPTVDPKLLEEIRLEHLLELPFEDTEPGTMK